MTISTGDDGEGVASADFCGHYESEAKTYCWHPLLHHIVSSKKVGWSMGQNTENPYLKLITESEHLLHIDISLNADRM